MDSDFKHLIDFSAVGTAFGAFFDILPHVSSLLAVVWIVIRIYESRTVKSLLNRRINHRTRKDDIKNGSEK
jgi:hypothetical protein